LDVGAPELRLYATLHFPDQLKAAIDEACIAAARQFRSEREKAVAAGDVNERSLAGLRLRWFWSVFLGFATGARDLVLAGTLKAAYFGACWQDFFGEAARAAHIEYYRPKVDEELKNSPEWTKFEELRLEAIRADVPGVKTAGGTEEGAPPQEQQGPGRPRRQDIIDCYNTLCGELPHKPTYGKVAAKYFGEKYSKALPKERNRLRREVGSVIRGHKARSREVHESP
jgi:hypothetical protein